MGKKFIICVTGLPGSGKTTVSHEVERMGFYYLNLGDIVREETRLRGYELTDANCGIVMLDLREKYGPQAIAQMSLKSLPEEGLIVVDGIRSVSEVQVFKTVGKTKLLAIHASPTRRFEMLASRRRSDAPLTREEFDIRDKRELEVGVGNAIALADEIVVNHSTIESLIENVRQLVIKWLKEVDF
ncbi:MAG: AAA family ATPase [Nitrososphaeria archaeon]